jgi:hypothetical protein
LNAANSLARIVASGNIGATRRLHAKEGSNDSSGRFLFGYVDSFINNDLNHLDDLFGDLPTAGARLWVALKRNYRTVGQPFRFQEDAPASPVAASRTAGSDGVPLQSLQPRSQAHGGSPP